MFFWLGTVGGFIMKRRLLMKNEHLKPATEKERLSIHLLLFCVLDLYCITILIPQHIYCNYKTHLIWTAVFKGLYSCDPVHPSRAQSHTLTQTLRKTNYPAQHTQHKCTFTQVFKSLCVLVPHFFCNHLFWQHGVCTCIEYLQSWNHLGLLFLILCFNCGKVTVNDRRRWIWFLFPVSQKKKKKNPSSLAKRTCLCFNFNSKGKEILSGRTAQPLRVHSGTLISKGDTLCKDHL